MKTIKPILLLAVICLFALPMSAQKIKLKGKPAFLLDAKELLVEYKYDNMKVGKKTEAEYVQKKTEKLNKKEAGKGDEWAKAWIEDREKRFAPNFEDLYNKHTKFGKVSREAKDATHKLVVHTTFTEPGYNVGVSRMDASLNMTITFVEIASNKVIATMTLDKVPGRGGMGYDFDTGFRIEEGYAKAGKAAAKYLAKKVK